MTETNDTFIRTKRQGCFAIKENPYWGTFCAAVDDPEGTVEALPQDALEMFELVENFPKIPGDLWNRIVNMYLDVLEVVGDFEASVRLMRSEDGSKWRAVVPPQRVSVAHVDSRSFSGAVDIETGEVIHQYPPLGWVDAGSSHSHGRLTCKWSTVDNGDEVKFPGLHILAYDLDPVKRSYKIAARTSQQQRLYDITPSDVIAFSDENAMPHPEAIKKVQSATALPGFSKFGFGQPKTTYVYGSATTTTKKNKGGSKTESANYDWQGWASGDLLAEEEQEMSYYIQGLVFYGYNEAQIRATFEAALRQVFRDDLRDYYSALGVGGI